MAVTYAAALKTTRMAAVIAAIDVNAAAAYIEIGTTAMASILATITLADPSFTESGGVITMAGAPKSDTSADNTGTAAEARIKDGGGNIIVSGLTVGTSGTNLVFNSVAFQAGQTVTLTSGTITHG